MRINIAAFIAGGALLLFLSELPEYWQWICAAVVSASLLSIYFNYSLIRNRYLNTILGVFCCLSLGFAWNAYYAQSRLSNILPIEYESKDLLLEGRVNALPQSSPSGAKFSFEVDQAFLGQKRIESFAPQVYLSWQPAWRNPQKVPDVVPGQRWKFKVKIKRPYGSLNPYTFAQ